jgi:hypothetical protein
MSAGLGLCGFSYGNIHTKADAIKFAIEMTMTRKEDGTTEFNMGRAKEMYDFICTNVELVDSDVVQFDKVLSSVAEEFKVLIKEFKSEKK